MADDRTEVPGKHKDDSMEFHLDEATKKKVIECIEKHGKITVVLKEKGVKSLGQDANGNGKLID